MRPYRIGAIGSLVLLGACADAPAGPPRVPPSINAASLTANADNVLSAIATISVEHADFVAIRFGLEGSSERDSITPVFPAAQGDASLPVLGLLPESRYTMRVIASGAGGTIEGAPLAFETGKLPADLPSYTASGTEASPGYVVLASGMYGVVLDNSGRVVWYHRFPNGPWLNFQAQPNGRYVARLVTPDATDVESWAEIDELGSVTRTFGCASGLQARFHDLIAERDGSYWILCDEMRIMDLTQDGGVAAAKVTGTAVQHISASGELLFNWSPFDHFQITDVDASVRTGVNVNWTHGNSLDLDADGNLLVSFRNLNEITKIDTRSGEVVWRLGGRRNNFEFADGAAPFAGQHSVRVLDRNHIVLLNNIGNALESRAERWTIDEQSGLARLTDSYGAVPGVRTLIGGSVQALSDSHTLVSFGTEGRVEEYDAQGVVRWRIDGAPGYVFRAQRIRSLYHPGMDAPR